MSINDLINNKNNRDMVSAFKKMADGKPVNLSIQPSAVQMPDKMKVEVLNPVQEVSINNLGDVLKSLSLLGVGVSDLKDSLDSLDLSKEISVEAADINFSPLVNAIESLKKEIKGLPSGARAAQPANIKFPKLEIPKKFTVDNFKEVTVGLKAINDNLVKLADVVKDSQPEINIPENDATNLIGAVVAVEKAVNSIQFPIPTPATPAFKNTSGEAASATIVGGSVQMVPSDVVTSGTTALTPKLR